MVVLTGVGGGILRDSFSGISPQVLKTRDIYASAGIFGALLYCFLLYEEAPTTVAMAIAVVVIVSIRMGALGFRWSLPVGPYARGKSKNE